MNHIFKPVFVTLMLMLTLTSAFSKPLVITLTADTAGNLYLTDGGNEDVGVWKNIVWKAGSGVKSFQILDSSINTDYIFKDALPQVQLSQVPEYVKTRFRGCVWYYGIIWEDMSGTPHYFDPKIAVKPIVSFYDLLISVGFLITLVTTLVFYSKWTTADTRVKKYEQEK
jgi:hypothetical protein